MRTLKEMKQMLSAIENPDTKSCSRDLSLDIARTAVNALESVEKQADFITALFRIVPAPDCTDCYSEMTLNEEVMLYLCTCHGGCNCDDVFPCPHCMVGRDAHNWVETYCEIREETDGYTDNACAGGQASGPSAAMAAKPVTKLIIGCQSNVWDGLENL